jgi:predicted SprT family Zn-dependent metalloprotease
MLIRPNIKTMFAEFNALYFENKIPTDLPVVWNTRMTTTAGYCRYKTIGWSMIPTKIDLCDKLFRTMDYNETEIRETLLHEMTHAYLMVTRNNGSHDWEFQSMMDRVTGKYKNHRTHSYDVSKISRKQEKKILGTCEWCGYEYKMVRMPKHAKYATYTHRGCGGPIVFSQLAKKDPEGTISIFG